MRSRPLNVATPKRIALADSDKLRRMALALEGTVAAPHFDRLAFKVVRIYATLAADGMTANLKFTPDEQALKCTLMPGGFVPLPNAWGARGWTQAELAKLSDADLAAALEMAWRHALPVGREKSARR
jgi:hypothetical protein